MKINNWQVFNKKGSNINWFNDSYLNIIFVTDSSSTSSASAYAITDPSGLINDVHISNSGWGYDSAYTGLLLSYTFQDEDILLTSVDASILYKDVSIFNPSPQNSTSIESVYIESSSNYIYPSVSYSGAIFMDPVSTELVETENLIIFEKDPSTGVYYRPYDASNSTLVFKFIGADDQIQLFDVDNENQIIQWTDEIIFDTSIYHSQNPIVLNIGFKSSDEGIFERRLRGYHRINNVDYLLCEILVNAQSIGQDERFDTIIQDFGLPNPKDIHKLFKEADINEDKPDWNLLNYKSKHIILEHDNIMPYIGTYKALVNSIKWLGYEDIQIKEWFKNVKDNKKLSLYIPYDATERSQTILKFSAEERKNLKKLNSLSLIYCITKETGEIDEWGNPLTENCYEYNINEILVKLYALKKWLEKNIIGVNARIVDITGEGIYFERFQNFIYATTNYGSNAEYKQSLSPQVLSESSELISGDASVYLTIKELSKTTINDLQYKFIDLVDYTWDTSNGALSPEDSSIIFDFDASLIRVGPTFQFPIYNLRDINWKMSVEKTYSGVLTNEFVTNPLFIYENEIRYYNILDTSSYFYDISTNLDIVIERAYLRDPSNDIWEDSSVYAIYPDPCNNGYYYMESSTGVITKFNGYIIFQPSNDTSTELQYSLDSNYNVPLLSFKNYKYTDSSSNTQILDEDKTYYLDIIDGLISMEASGNTQYINFNYDTSLNEQKITLNVIYESGRIPLYVYDPSIYYYKSYLNEDPSNALVIDNSIYKINVNHIGDYNIEVFGWDSNNNLFSNSLNNTYNIWTKYPIINSYIDTSIINTIESSIYLTEQDVSTIINNNLYPLFDRYVPLYGLTLNKDLNNKPYLSVPSISYFVDVPEKNSLSKVFNLTEKITSVNSTSQIVVDPDYQSFLTNDDINIVLFDKGKYSLISQSENNISSISGNIINLSTPMSSSFVINASTDIYIQNNTLRSTSSIINYESTSIPYVTLDVSNYQFNDNQLVGVIITDTSTNYQWGSSYRVLDVSANDTSLGYWHKLEGNIPQFIVDSSRYTIQAKHAFSTFVDFQLDVSLATEKNNNFELYHNDMYYYQYSLDNTFAYLNILFDQGYVIDQWYNPSDNLINSNFYKFNKAIEIDISTLVILKAVYDPSNYMINQKNIWTITNNDNGNYIMKVFNESVPFIFNEAGTYNITAESYDSFGNLRAKQFDGLIKVINE